jgi:hypothetical protein
MRTVPRRDGVPCRASALAASCMVMPDSAGESGQMTAFPSKKPMLVMASSAMTPPGPVSSASSKPALSAARPCQI